MTDDFSERFRVALAGRLPDLTRHLRPGEDGSLELRLPAPSGHGELAVSTSGGEVTVGFGPWCVHFEEREWWPDGESPRGGPFERPVSLLADLMRDLVVIRIWTEQGQYAASGPWHCWYAADPCREACLGDHYSAISWTGRGDLPPVPVDPAELRAWYQRMS